LYWKLKISPGTYLKNLIEYADSLDSKIVNLLLVKGLSVTVNLTKSKPASLLFTISTEFPLGASLICVAILLAESSTFTVNLLGSYADLGDILSTWSGLGYYRRAKNIYLACRIIEDKHNSKFPNSFNEIIKLPGIGRTTAAAITTFSNNGQYTILDANVKRLLSRLYNVTDMKNTERENLLWSISENLLSKSRPGDFIQAYMDLGSIICTSRKPHCDKCPLSNLCYTNIRYPGVKNNISSKKPQKLVKEEKLWSLVIIDCQNNLYLEKISIGNLWPGLYSSPIFTSKSKLLEWAKSKNLSTLFTKKFFSFQHRLSHINFTIDAFLCCVDKDKKISLIEDNWYNLSNITIGVPKYQNKIIDKFRQVS